MNEHELEEESASLLSQSNPKEPLNLSLSEKMSSSCASSPARNKSNSTSSNINMSTSTRSDINKSTGSNITCSNKNNNQNKNNNNTTKRSNDKEDKNAAFTKKQRRKAVMYMTLAMATHFAGHEFARSPTMSMFTSTEMGFQSSAVLPLAVGCMSPFSICLLWSYSKMLKRVGPRFALAKSTLFGSSFILLIGSTLFYIKHTYSHPTQNIHPLSKYLLFAAFVFQGSNVQFLYTQHWSFIGSVLTPNEIASYASLIAGIGSLTSTFAAAYVSELVEHIGLIGAQCTAAIIIGSSSIFANQAYHISSIYGFEPKHDSDKKYHANSISSSLSKKENLSKKMKKSNIMCSTKSDNILYTSKALFNRVPIIGAMFIEVLMAQCLSSLLNFHFVSEVKNEILDDEVRAGFTGKCYAYVNGISGILQFFILPFVVKRIGAKWLWLTMPLIMLSLTSLQFHQQHPSLTLVGLTFLTMKTIEYSLRGQASEMVWVMLDYESRFIGKELINLFGNRLGKSTTAICLFLLAMQLEKDSSHDVREFAVNSSMILAFLWLLCTIRVTRLIPSKETG